MPFVRACLFVGVIGSCGSAAFALPQPTLGLGFSSGRVTVNAVDVPAADVLRAWADVGHTQVTGIENLGVRRITLRLSLAPEETALATIVGQRSWFNATVRSFSGVSESTLGRIDILPAALSANDTTPTPEQRYQYPQTAITSEVAEWAGHASPYPASPRPQPYPETMYDYPSLGGFGDPYKILATANAANEQPIIQPGTEPPVPERIYEYPGPRPVPEWMMPAASRPGSAAALDFIAIPEVQAMEGFGDGPMPGELVDQITGPIRDRVI